MMDRIWRYYSALAEKAGLDKKGKKQGYSVRWFYEEQGTPCSLNSLSRAFLGEENSRGGLHVSDETEIAPISQRGYNEGLTWVDRKIGVSERMQRRLAAFCGPTDRYTVRGI